MEKRYSEMTASELQREIGLLTEKARKAEQIGIVNELAVHERKIAMAKAYLLDPAGPILSRVMYMKSRVQERIFISAT